MALQLTGKGKDHVAMEASDFSFSQHPYKIRFQILQLTSVTLDDPFDPTWKDIHIQNGNYDRRRTELSTEGR